MEVNRLLTEAVLGNIGPRSWQYDRGTLFLIVKCTSGAINLFSFLSFSFLSFQSFYLSIFLAFSGSSL